MYYVYMGESDLNSETINLIPCKKKRDSKKRYKITEILLIISALGVVIFLGLLAINPSKKASEARNLKRSADASTILTYVSGYVSQERSIPDVIPSSQKCVEFKQEICKTGPYNCTDLVNMNFLSRGDTDALVVMPNDPLYISPNGTGYYIFNNGTGIVTVCAPYAERNEQISFSKNMY